jgi:hypothetical protein
MLLMASRSAAASWHPRPPIMQRAVKAGVPASSAPLRECLATADFPWESSSHSAGATWSSVGRGVSGWPLLAVLCAGSACTLTPTPDRARAAEPFHGGHYLVSTTQAWLDGRRPEGVVHVARDGRSLVVHTGIEVLARCGAIGYEDEIRIDGAPAVKLTTANSVSYHVERKTPDSHDLIDFEGRFVTRRRFEGVLHVHFSGSPTSGPPCATPWIRVTGWYARRNWRRYSCVNQRRHRGDLPCEPTPGTSVTDTRKPRSTRLSLDP